VETKIPAYLTRSIENVTTGIHCRRALTCPSSHHSAKCHQWNPRMPAQSISLRITGPLTDGYKPSTEPGSYRIWSGCRKGKHHTGAELSDRSEPECWNPLVVHASCQAPPLGGFLGFFAMVNQGYDTSLAQDILIHICSTTSSLDTPLLGLSKRPDVAVHRILQHG